MQKSSPIFILLVFFTAILNCAYSQPKQKAFKIQPYLKVSTSTADLSEDVLYPQYFREHDQFSYERILEGFRVRWEFIQGIRPEDRFQDCHRKLRRIEEAIKLLKSEKEINVRWIDDNFVFNPKSPIKTVQKIRRRKVYKECKYSSLGDLASGGVIFCKHHGIAFDSPSYEKCKDQIEKHRPLFTPDDVVDLILFSPIILIIPFLYYILVFVLNKPPQNRSQN